MYTNISICIPTTTNLGYFTTSLLGLPMTHISHHYVQPTKKKEPKPSQTHPPLTWSLNPPFPLSPTSISPLHPPPFPPPVNIIILRLVLAQVIHGDTENLPQISAMMLHILSQISTMVLQIHTIHPRYSIFAQNTTNKSHI